MNDLLTVPRFNWYYLFGKTLTKYILELKIGGRSCIEAYEKIIEHPKIIKLMRDNPYLVNAIEEKIRKGVSARYSENNIALRTYYELKKNSWR